MAQKHIRKGSVAVGYVHMNDVTEVFSRSMAESCLRPSNNIKQIIAASNPRQEVARNAVVQLFLDGACEWLMWIDTDMSFEPDSIERLLQTAKRHKADAVGGLAFIYKKRQGQIVPNGYKWKDNDWWEISEYPKGRVIEVDGTGAAFVLIHRTLFEKFPRPGEWHQTWMHHPAHDAPMGHDLAFFWEVTQTMGGKLLWDTSVRTGHVKRFELTEESFESYKEGISG